MNKMLIGQIAGGVALMGVLTGSYLLYSGERMVTYSTLNTDVPANTRIDPEMLDEVVIPESQRPPLAIDKGEAQSGNYFTNRKLPKGALFAEDAIRSQQDLSVAMPDDHVRDSFIINANAAAGGDLQVGDFFDVFFIDGQHKTFSPYVNVLVLDIRGVETQDGEIASGQQQITIHGTPSEIKRFKSLRSMFGQTMSLGLSPRKNYYEEPSLDEYKGAIVFGAKDLLSEVLGPDGTPIALPDPVNLGKDSDPSFTPVKRDEFGRPVEEVEDCSPGNAVISGEACKKINQPGSAEVKQEAPAVATESPQAPAPVVPEQTPSAQ